MYFLIALVIFFNPDREIGEFIWGHRNPQIDRLMQVVSWSANKEVLASEGVLLFALGDKKTRSEVIVCGSWGLMTAIMVYGMKAIVKRPRPDGVYTRFNSSFPSGHTSAAFLIAGYASNKHPNLKIPLFLWASMVGYSRVYLRRHWPSDVIAGAFIGYLSSRLALKTERKILKFLKFD